VGREAGGGCEVLPCLGEPGKCSPTKPEGVVWRVGKGGSGSFEGDRDGLGMLAGETVMQQRDASARKERPPKAAYWTAGARETPTKSKP